MKPKTEKKKSDKKSSKSTEKIELNETQPYTIKEKTYVTQEIETTITLLESPESNLVLEALLFLSKYADIHLNNLVFVQSRGLMPKLLALFDHNICILRVALRLLSQLLTVEDARLELNQERFNKDVKKICSFYIGHSDLSVKEFASYVLATYSLMGKANVLLEEAGFIKALVKTINEAENENILLKSLEMFWKFIETETFRENVPQEQGFNMNIFMQEMHKSEECFKIIVKILEKITYFGDNVLQTKLKDCRIIEHMFNLILIPEKKEFVQNFLNIVLHCMCNDNTNSYFVISFEFLKFCQWSKTCPNEVMEKCANIFLELSKIDSIRQMLFDLSVEDIILSFLRSDEKKVLNVTCHALSFMSKHKYCCEKMVTPVVVKKLLQIMQRDNDIEDPQNEIVLGSLYYLCRRDSRTIHMICSYDGLDVILKYTLEKKDKLSPDSYRKVLEIVNMFVTNNQLQSRILSSNLYNVILTQTSSEFDEICMRSLEIMINCLNYQDFQNYFLLNKGSEVVVKKLSNTSNEHVTRLLVIFVHNALVHDVLAKDLVHKKILLVLKNLPEVIKYRNPLVQRVINLIYDSCLPLKFFETGKLELTDKMNERFYVIAGPWNEQFPFLEVLELRRISTLSTVYVVDECEKIGSDKQDHDCLNIHQQYIGRDRDQDYSGSISSLQTRCTINYGLLSHDPYLPKYSRQVEKLISDVDNLEKKIKLLADFVNECLCGPDEKLSIPDKLHTFKFHIECLKQKLGTNMIPIGYLRLGFHCERALLFKALADHVYIPVTLVKGKNKLYWNEVALIQKIDKKGVLKMFVVDLMNNIGQLLAVGSRECNVYCDIQ